MRVLFRTWYWGHGNEATKDVVGCGGGSVDTEDGHRLEHKT